MADPNEGSINVAAADEFDTVVLGAEGLDVEAVAQAIAAGMNPDGATKDDIDADAAAKADADAKVQAEAEEKAKAEAEAKAKADADAQAAASSGKEPKIEGVLLRDGKHVAPYAVLEGARASASAERQAREEAEARAKELQTELEKLRSGQATDPAHAAALSDDLNTRIDELRDASPELAEVFDPLLKTVANLTSQVKGFSDREEQQRQAQQDELNKAVQDAIDANPKLSWAKAHNAQTWNRIADQDAVLRADPANRGLTFEDRFGKAVKAVEAIYGEITLPPEYLPTPNADANKAEAEAKAKAEADAKAKAEADAKAKAGITNDDAKARAEAELKKADEVAKNKPFTLSDLPGGAPPQSADKAVAEMTPAEVDAKVGRFLESGGRVEDIPSLFSSG